MTEFTIDNLDLNDGDVELKIHHKGKNFPCKFERSQNNKFHVSFDPEGSGKYEIEVFYEGEEITGSPFQLEVVDLKDISISEDSFSPGEVGQTSEFFFRLKRNSNINDVKILITSPRGLEVSHKIRKMGDEQYKVEIQPKEEGTYSVEITYFEKKVGGTPFFFTVTDINQIQVLGLPQSGKLNKNIDFFIDVSKSGEGKLKISINDDVVPCMVNEESEKRIKASFIPIEPIPHVIRLFFNDKELPSSPWVVDIKNYALSAKLRARGEQNVLVNNNVLVDLEVNNFDSEVVAQISTPSRRTINGSVINERTGSYLIDFVPREAGPHLLTVTVDGMAIYGSPFLFKAYNPNSIFINSHKSETFLNQPVDITVDASKAGEGSLEAFVNNGEVKNIIKEFSKGVFTISFIPKELKTHFVTMNFNGMSVPQTPITIFVRDNRRINYLDENGSLQSNFYNQQQQYSQQYMQHQNHLYSQNQMFQLPPQVIESDIKLIVTAPNGEIVPAQMKLQSDGNYKLDLNSPYTGRHKAEIISGGSLILGSPFFVEIFDPNNIKIEGNRRGMVGERMELNIIRNKAGKADLKVTVKSPKGNIINHDQVQIPQGDRVSYIAKESGVHTVDVTFGKVRVPGCPVKQDIFDASSIKAEGEGLYSGYEDRESKFEINTGGQKGNLKIVIKGPNTMPNPKTSQDSLGNYLVTYIPEENGRFLITIKWNDRDILGSPWKPEIRALRKVSVVGGLESLLNQEGKMDLKLNHQKVIQFATKYCGKGPLSATLTGPSGSCPVEVIKKENDIYLVSFVPTEEGEYKLKVFWQGSHVEKSPFYGFIKKRMTKSLTKQQEIVTTSSSHQTINEKLVMTGTGLKQAIANQPAEFFIDGTNAAYGVAEVYLMGSNGPVPVDLIQKQEKIFKCSYTPPYQGIYKLHIIWGNKELDSSPFEVVVGSIYGSSPNPYFQQNNISRDFTDYNYQGNYGNEDEISKLSWNIDEIQNCKVNKEVRVKVNIIRVKEGELKALVYGPNNKQINIYTDKKKYEKIFCFTPEEPGPYVLNLFFNNQHLLGSPKKFKVNYPFDPKKVKCGGRGLESGPYKFFDPRFVIDTKEAGSGSLMIEILSQKYGQVLTHSEQQDKKVFCSFQPPGPGDYEISILYSGHHINGSPFRVRLYENQPERKSGFRGSHYINHGLTQQSIYNQRELRT